MRKTATAPNIKKASQLLGWLKQPESWISIVAAIISIVTFFWVYAYQGKLEVTIPSQIGVAKSGYDKLQILVPFVFTNTGATRTHRHITNITANIIPLSNNGAELPSALIGWTYEVQFISTWAYHTKYPDQQVNMKQMDKVDYVSRAFPFHLEGGDSVSKVYIFEQKDGTFDSAGVGNFMLVITIWTNKEHFTMKSKYLGNIEISADFSYFDTNR